MDRCVQRMRWVVTAALLAACTGTNATTEDPTASDAGTTATASPSDTPTATSPAADPGPAETWQAFHDERLSQLGQDGEPDPTGFASLATEAGVDLAMNLVAAGRSEITRAVSDHAAWPSVDLASDGTTATVEDCVVVATTGDASARTQAWTGDLVLTDDGWRVETAAPGADDCAPAALTEEVLAAYETWLDGIDEWWDPPDPDHPQIEQAMTGEGLEDMRDVLAQHREEGVAVRDSHDAVNAVVFEVGVDEATVSDCWSAAVGNEFAAFDVETGDRLEELSPVPEGDRTDRLQVDLVRDGDRWLVAGWLSRTGADCTPGGSPYVVVP